MPAGALSAYTSRLLSSSEFKNVRDVLKGISGLMPAEMQKVNAKIDEYARGMMSGGTLFEELGFYYIGPIDGHDLDTLVSPLGDSIGKRASVSQARECTGWSCRWTRRVAAVWVALGVVGA